MMLTFAVHVDNLQSCFILFLISSNPALSKPELSSEKSICASQAAQEAGKKHAQTSAGPAVPKQDAAKGPEPKQDASKGPAEPKQDAAKGPVPVKKKGGAPMPPMPTMAQQKVI